MKKALIIFSIVALLPILSGCRGNASANTDTEKSVTAQDQTTMDLLYALAGECQASRKYLAFAEKADAEGYPEIAALFRAASAAESIHAGNHMRALGMIKSTDENLKSVVEGEANEFEKMYPKFIKTADAAGRKDASKSFDMAFKVEEIHHQLFSDALAAEEKGVKGGATEYHVCKVCGDTVPGPAPDKCPLCNAGKEMFIEIK